MTAGTEERGERQTDRPVLLVVDDDAEDLELVSGALERRFGADYQVSTAAASADALELLARLAREGAPVALVAADLRLRAVDGIELLRRAHALHSGAGRALFVPMDGGATDAVLRASALGQIDLSILKGWVSPEEWLYPQIQEALSAWATSHRPRHEHVRVVGDRWSPRSHDLRDLLSRNSVPFGFYAADSDEGRRLLAEHGLDPARLPVAILFDGGRSSASTTASSRRRSASARGPARSATTSPSWEPGPPASPPPCTARPRGSGRSSSSSARREARPRPARGSATTSASPAGSAAASSPRAPGSRPAPSARSSCGLVHGATPPSQTRVAARPGGGPEGPEGRVFGASTSMYDRDRPRGHLP